MIKSYYLFIFILFWVNTTIHSQTIYDEEAKVDVILTENSLSTKDLRVQSSHISSISGAAHIYLGQVLNGLDILGTESQVHYSSEGDLIQQNSRLMSLSSPDSDINPALYINEVFRRIADNLSIGYDDIFQINQESDTLFTRSTYDVPALSKHQVHSRMAYVILPDGKTELIYDVVILDAQDYYWNILVSATDGRIIRKIPWTVECNISKRNDQTTHTHHKQCTHSHHPIHNLASSPDTDIMAPDSYTVYPLGIESPNHGSLSTEVNPADPNASPFGWHDIDGIAGAESTTTFGNNALATEDINNTNGGGTSPSSPTLDFNYIPNFNNPPADPTNLNAAITNLFYWNNILHDVWYQYGFDENSGNFQSNNYGNGGSGNDYVIADAQDGSGTNNANFGTPPDGFSPRMQMYIWTRPSISTFAVNTPFPINGMYNIGIASFGPQAYNITSDVIIADDGSAMPSEGCGSLINGGAIAGNIALIDRGNCEFGTKALNAQNAGAIGVIICNNVPGSLPNMGPGVDGAFVTIPAIMISQGDCATIRAQIPTVNVTMTGSPPTGQSLDSDFDNGIIGHEYGHGISNRLVGGPTNVSCLGNNEQMGEGWSDWIALMLTTNSNDVGTGSSSIGTYSNAELPSGNGIRPYPYSTDFSINPQTYSDVAPSTIPHGLGSVWCTMLWEMTWDLADVYGWDDDYYYGTGGNNIAMQLVIEGMKLTPCNPGFVDGRDAILAADQLLYGGAHQCLIWNAFAIRGLGFSASQGSSFDSTDGMASFDMPPLTCQSICPSCYVTLTHNGGCSLSTNEVSIADYESSSWIKTSSQTIINNGAFVDYDATDYIILGGNHDFTVQQGANFAAFIDGCNNGGGGINLKANNTNIKDPQRDLILNQKEAAQKTEFIEK